MGDFKISLEAARRNAGLTQSQVAKKIGVTKETVLRWEKNPEKALLGKIKKLCDLYKCSINNIFF